MSTDTARAGSAFETPTARTLATSAPWQWLAKAWADYRRAPVLCAGYGLLFVAVGYGIIFGLSRIGLTAAIPVAIGGFALVGPLMAAGLYALAREHERGQRPGWRDVVLVRAASPMQVAYLGVFVLVGLLVWMLCAVALLVIFAVRADVPAGEFMSFALGTGRGLALVSIGTVVGAVIAFAMFALSAFSIPMLIDRETNFVTAMAASAHVVRTQSRPMILWAWIIAASMVVGATTLLFGFVILFPLIGLATWHAYRDAFGDQ